MISRTVWQVLSIDAISSVNLMTKKALENSQFLGKDIHVLNACSIQQAKRVLTDSDDIAVVLLDTMNDGLEESLSFIRFIRDTLKNYRTRIILRTGYPDTLPDISLIENYEIDGYISKETMPAMQIKIAVMTAIRSYHQILTTTESLQALAGSIAHETRNPLAQVKYTLDAIRKILGSTTLLSASHGESRNLFQLVQQGLTAIKRGERVITGVMNEVGNQAVDPKTFSYLSAAKTTQKAIDESVEMLNAKNRVCFEIIKDFSFRVEETLYLFILFNLIKNALYYFKGNPHATLTITIDGNTNMVKVHDTGPGIPSQLLPRLFNSFFTSGKEGGTSLGLSYCTRTMQAFGGDITCNSVVNKFTEFTLSFPTVTTEELGADEKEALTRVVEEAPIGNSFNVLSDKTVIIADDDEVGRQYIMMSLQLGNPSVTVLEAQNGEEVLALLQQHKVDAILIDMVMRPGMGGIDATKAIRAGQTQPNVPIIALTANVGDMYIEETKAAGMNDFLTKPIEDAVLLEKLIQYIDPTHYRLKR